MKVRFHLLKGKNFMKWQISKDVCSWIDCRKIEVEPANLQVGNPIFYNPKIKPYWFDSNDNNIDGYRFDVLTTNGNKVIEPASIAV